MTEHRSKNRYLLVAEAMRAADKYTKMYGFIHRFYKCDECPAYHLTQVMTKDRRKVLSLEALRHSEGDGS